MRLHRPLLSSLILAAALAPPAGAAALPGREGVARSAPPAPVVASLQPTLFAAAGYDGSAEGSFLTLVNAQRASVGVGALIWDGSLTNYARGHAQYQASVNNLHHSNIAALLGQFSVVGENVGIGPNVGAIHQAFLASPEHYRNLADPVFTHVGIGVFVDGAGRTWTAHEFGRP